MKKRSRLSILAGLSAAAGVKVSLFEALGRIEAKGNLAQATYPTETRRVELRWRDALMIAIKPEMTYAVKTTLRSAPTCGSPSMARQH